MPSRAPLLLVATLGLGLVSAHAGAAAAAGPPTVTAPCAQGDANQVLTTDGKSPVVCWGAACLAYGDDDPKPVPRPPAPAPVVVPTTVDGARICTGARCTPIGPHARAAIAKARAAVGKGPGAEVDLHATGDHAILVIEQQGDAYRLALWNVARDRALPLPDHSDFSSGQEMHELAGAAALDNRVLVTRSCNEWCDADGYLVYATGGGRSPFGASGDLASGVQVIDAHDFLVVSAMGELSWIDHGAVSAQAYLFGGDFKERDVDLAWARIDADTFAVQSCRNAFGCVIGTVWRQSNVGDHPLLYVDLQQGMLPSCIDAHGNRRP